MKKQIWTKEKSSVYQDQEEIVIPKEITRIQDYSFESCKELKRIIVKKKDSTGMYGGAASSGWYECTDFCPERSGRPIQLNSS